MMIDGGTELSGGSETINGSGGAKYLPTVGRNTLRLPVRSNVDLRLERTVTLPGRWRASFAAETFNLLNTPSTSVETRAFAPGTVTGGVTPLVFQDTTALAAEGDTTTTPFGQPLSSTTGILHERRLQLSARFVF